MLTALVRRMARSLGVDVTSPLVPVARRYAWTVPIVVLYGLVSSALEGAGISLLIPILSMLNSDSQVVGPPALGRLWSFMPISGAFATLQGVTAIVLAAALLKAAVDTANAMFVSRVDGMASRDIRSALAKVLLTIDYPFFLVQEPSRLVNIIATESWRGSEAIRAFFSLLAALASVLVFGCLLFWVNPPLFLVVVVAAGALRYGHWAAAQRLGLLSDDVTSANRSLGQAMIRLSADVVKTVRLFGEQAREHARFEASSEQVRLASLAVERLTAIVNAIFEVSQVVLFIAILLGAWWTRMEVPLLVAFLVLLYRLQPQLRAVGNAWITLAATRGSVREVEWLLRAQDRHPPMQGWLVPPALDGAIVFDRVSYAYPGADRGEPALSGASFELRSGRAVALTGRSGAGKSTVVNILCRLFDPDTGVVRVDGVDLAQIDPIAWRAQIAVAGQDIDLLDGTIAENVRYGSAAASDEDIAAAARAADAERFIGELPAGFETRVGTRGLSLSGGQRQRIGIARALLRRPRLLIFDEATNAVDAISEGVIKALIAERPAGQSLLVISHNARTRSICQDEIVLEHGRVVRFGPIDETKPAARSEENGGSSLKSAIEKAQEK